MSKRKVIEKRIVGCCFSEKQFKGCTSVANNKKKFALCVVALLSASFSALMNAKLI